MIKSVTFFKAIMSFQKQIWLLRKKQLYNQVKYLPIYLLYQQTFQIVLNRNNAACISQFPKQ